MSTKSTVFLSLSVVALAVIFGVYLYPQLPANLVSHWNGRGQADGEMSKFWTLFLMPSLSFVLLLLYMAIPYLDPKKENIEKFRGYYNGMIIITMLFLFYLDLLIIFYNLGYRLNMLNYLIPAFSVLFFYIGIMMTHIKSNWFVGIRTPWTMSSETVWHKTHVLGGKLFKISAILALLGLVFPDYAMVSLFAPLLLSSFYIILYSYVEYKKEKGRE